MSFITSGTGVQHRNYNVLFGNTNADNGGDPYFSLVTLLVPGNGDFTDYSPLAATITAGGAISFQSAIPLFDLPTVETTPANIVASFRTPSGPEYEMENEDFTMEGFIYVKALNAGGTNFLFREVETAGAVSTYNLAINGTVEATARVQMSSPNGAGTTASTFDAAGNFALNTWFHLAMTRQGNTYRLFRNGILVGSRVDAYRRPPSDRTIIACNNSAAGATCADALYGQFRVTYGVARYTADFAVPSEPFPTFGP